MQKDETTRNLKKNSYTHHINTSINIWGTVWTNFLSERKREIRSSSRHLAPVNRAKKNETKKSTDRKAHITSTQVNKKGRRRSRTLDEIRVIFPCLHTSKEEKKRVEAAERRRRSIRKLNRCRKNRPLLKTQLFWSSFFFSCPFSSFSLSYKISPRERLLFLTLAARPTFSIIACSTQKKKEISFLHLCFLFFLFTNSSPNACSGSTVSILLCGGGCFYLLTLPSCFKTKPAFFRGFAAARPNFGRFFFFFSLV